MQPFDADSTERAADIAPATEEAGNKQPAPDPKTVFLGGLFALALLAAMQVASDILLPLVLAFILKLLLQPAMRWLESLHVPRMIAANPSMRLPLARVAHVYKMVEMTTG